LFNRTSSSRTSTWVMGWSGTPWESGCGVCSGGGRRRWRSQCSGRG